MRYIRYLLNYEHYTFIESYFIVVKYHSSCDCHLLLYGIRFVIKYYVLILNRLMSSLGVFLCIIFVSYSLETSNHLVKSIICYFVIALVHFFKPFGFSIIQYFESHLQWSLRYIWTYHILYKCLFMTVDIRYEICTVNFLVYLHDIQNFCGASHHISDSQALLLSPKNPFLITKIYISGTLHSPN